MVNLEWQSGSQTWQVIATPQVPVDRFHGELSGLPAQVSKPGPSLANATLAVRYGFEWLGCSADIMAVRGWQASPALRPVVDAIGLRLQGAMSRQNSIGFSADKSLVSTVVRLEGTTPGFKKACWLGSNRGGLTVKWAADGPLV